MYQYTHITVQTICHVTCTIQTVSILLIVQKWLHWFLRTKCKIKVLHWHYNLTLGLPHSMQPFLRYGQNNISALSALYDLTRDSYSMWSQYWMGAYRNVICVYWYIQWVTFTACICAATHSLNGCPSRHAHPSPYIGLQCVGILCASVYVPSKSYLTCKHTNFNHIWLPPFYS